MKIKRKINEFIRNLGKTRKFKKKERKFMRKLKKIPIKNKEKNEEIYEKKIK